MTVGQSLNSVGSDIYQIPVPRSIKEARNSPHVKQWECAIQTEYNALLSNSTWQIDPLPRGWKALGCHWLFDVKYKADGTVDRFNARLVVQGTTQLYGIDYKRWEVNGVKHLLIVCVYVDNPTIVGSHLSSVNDLKANLSETFTMKDL
ncbi:hypothetical protein PHMEG_00029686, partial [Phytophthora megakarya]